MEGACIMLERGEGWKIEERGGEGEIKSFKKSHFILTVEDLFSSRTLPIPLAWPYLESTYTGQTCWTGMSSERARLQVGSKLSWLIIWTPCLTSLSLSETGLNQVSFTMVVTLTGIS